MDHKNFGQLNVKPLVDDLVQKLDDAATRLQKEGEDAGEAFGRGWDEGLNDTVEKIKASSIKTEKAFKNLSDKIRKQVQQLTTNIGGKDTKIKIDFSDIDINSDTIKKKIEQMTKSVSMDNLIEFDTKGSEQQLKNLITLYVKYQEKLNALRTDTPNLSSSDAVETNLKQQLVLASKLREIWSFLQGPSALGGYGRDIRDIRTQLEAVQKLTKITQGSESKVSGDYSELAKVLKEIQDSLQIISNTFKNENNSMKTMAESGKTSFESFSQAIVEVYNNLTQVQSLVDTISQKDFNVTNITQTGGGNSNMQAMKQQMAIARETMEHLRQLYDQASGTLTLLGQGGQVGVVMEYAQQLQELNLTDINKSIKGANTEMKLASVLAEMQDYIDKLTQINELRNKYNLGAWKDTFVPTQKATVKPATPKPDTTTVVESPKEIAPLGNAEAQQMWQLKGAIDEVNNAIGRKNAGFIKEQEIVDTSVNAEEAKLRELVGVITNEIGTALDDIKGKFGQSFVVPELDKGNLQSSFDEIYNKFVELKDKIGTMQIGVGVNSREADSSTGVFSNVNSTYTYGEHILSKDEEIESLKIINALTEDDLNNEEKINQVLNQRHKIWDQIQKYYSETVTPNNLSFYQDKTKQPFHDNIQAMSEAFTEDEIRKFLFPIEAQFAKALKSVEIDTKQFSPTSDRESIDSYFSRRFHYDEHLDEVFEKWFNGAGRSFRDTLGQAIDSDDGLKTASLSSFWMRYNNYNKSNMPYEEFLNTPIPMYRSDKNLDASMNNEYISLSLDEKQAQKFGEQVVQYMIKPIDTIGTPNTRTYAEESEIIISTAKFKSSQNAPKLQEIVEQKTDDQDKAESKPSEVKITPTMDEGAVAKVVADNVVKTPATVKVTPIVDSASNTEQAVDGEAQSAVDAAKQFIDAANAKKQFVEANKQVAEGAKESAKAVKEEAEATEQAKQTMTAVADDTVQPSNWDRVAKFQTDHGEDPFALSRSRTENVGNESVRTIVESWSAIRDEDGELTGDMQLNTVKIINDFKKRTDAITKENEKIKTAQAYLQKFLTQFNNKTMGKGRLLSGYQDLEELANRDNNDPNSKKFTIDDIAKAEQMMSNLDAEYNKVVQSMRKGSSSMNPFVNAINSMDKMEDVLRGISLQFRTLDQQPDWLKEDVTNLYRQLDDLSAETDIYKFAEGFGNLKVSINSVTESIRQQRAEQKLALSDFKALVKATKTRDTNTEKAAKEEDGSVWKTYYTDRAAEQQKMIDAIRIGLTLTKEQEAQLNAMAEKHALILRDINLENAKAEEQKQKYEEIMSLLEKNHANQVGLDSGALKVVDKDAYQKRLDDERTKIDALIKDADLNPQQAKSVEQFVKLIASLKVESSNIDLMSKKWMEQNILTDEAKAKIEALKQSLLRVTSGTELDLWKKKWKELTNEMSKANIDAKEDKSIGKLIEKDRIAKVKKYIDLLKLQYDYEKKAAKEDDGSKMQSFYKNHIAEIKDELQKTDIQALENQDEKNRRLALEEEKQRAIAEIQAQREKAQQKKQDKEAEKQLFVPQDKKIQERFDAGYLNKGQYDNWQRELVEYQSYMKGVTQADEATIANKRQSLMQLYDTLVKTSNASKAFFTSGGEILPQEMWLDKSQIDDTSKSLTALYNNIATERFEGMKTSITGVNDKLGKLNFVVDDGQGSLTQYTIALDKASGATKLLQNNTKPALTVLQKFGQSLKKDFTGLLTAVMGGTSIHTFVQYMRQGIQSVRELDLALTELKKVTDDTEETYDRFLDTAASTSARIGSTLSNMTSATAEFAKLGYDINTAADMAESALVYTNVGDNVDVETGSQSIISTMKAFGIEANNTMSIVDKFNEVGELIALR